MEKEIAHSAIDRQRDAGTIDKIGEKYTFLQIVLHWLVAGLVLVQWLTYDAIHRTHRPLLPPSVADLREHALHNYGGIAIGVLVGLRLLLRLTRGRHRPPVRTWADLTASSVHASLYLLLASQAATGFAASYLTGAAAPVHRLLWTLMWPVILLHVAAAVYHLARRDGVASRMLPGRRPTTP